MKSVFSNDYYEGSLLGYYRNAFWEMDVDPNDPNTMCELKLVARQYLKIRNDVQSITSFADLEKWLNERQFEVYAAPLNILDVRRYVTRYGHAHIDSVEPKQINHTFHHDVMLDESFGGKGWDVEIWFTVGAGRFDQLGLKLGLAAYGIYTYSISYSQNHDRQPCYKVCAYILKRDFKMTDGKAARWNHDPVLNQDEDDEDNLTEAERRARMFEEGLLDNEIAGIDNGNR